MSASLCLVEIVLISNHMLFTLFCFWLLHQSNIFAPELIPAETKGDKMKVFLFITKN